MKNTLKKIATSALIISSISVFSQNTQAQPAASATEETTTSATKPVIEGLIKKINANPKDTQSLVNLATAYSEAKNYTESINTWKKVTEIIPTWAPAYYAEAIVHQTAQENDNAKVAYEKYISLVKPEEVDAYKANLAYAHFFLAYMEQTNNKELAKQHILKSLQYDPSNQEALNLSEALNK